ncbi:MULTISPECIES: coniferyl aldehyde dehydrogenase [Stenotrophomonas]|jgi:coniferyl-aldehyde dehydrogenase|uniref:Aldehyde dehydrogenase n=1 Tax=Stenotrophomonas maltophilia TaxID=40324 RepID=A0A4S2CU87_STEMA|nr:MULTISPECIES: coniferyl aldehyde dehydrogenase [Stenotrophomonas]MBD3826457.1 coniferyl aldehyde dehydrogenase [Stenotrophomonas sp.]TGY32448.1 coniferyl aldehyde dehydrogenase [Stenotrophomonas maltophilia]
MSDTHTDPAALPALLHVLRSAWQANRPSLDQRRDDLQRLRAALKARLPQMAEAISADFGHRSTHESLIADGMTVLNEIDHLLRHLRGWMRPRRVGVGWRFWPARAQTRPVPLGVVGVISPWNYPVNLALIPLATAIAAGNHVILKPSEHTPRTSAFLQDLLAQVFPAHRVAVVQGDAELASALAGSPLDHLVFTGSTAVGRKVMAAAAQHLTPLTLELGGKSPAIVCSDYPLDKAAARLATGKWFNAGQTCIAPDYILIDGRRQRELVQQLQTQVRARYGDFSDPSDYTRIIHAGQYQRLRGYLEQARARGVPVIELASVDPARAERERLIVPTIVLDPPADLDLMQEEIFGPILPVCAYPDLDAALAGVQARDRPLALYVFSQQRDTVERVLDQIVAGGVTVNDTLLHFAINGLPFGGVGPSGMGAYHARAGFDAMSKQLPVLWQSRWAASDLLKPPYAKIAGMLRALVR